MATRKAAAKATAKKAPAKKAAARKAPAKKKAPAKAAPAKKAAPALKDKLTKTQIIASDRGEHGTLQEAGRRCPGRA
jgi:hypothetical protein